MAKLRRNHSSSGRGGFMGRAVTVTIALIVAMIYGFVNLGMDGSNNDRSNKTESKESTRFIPINIQNIDYVPLGDHEQVIHHSYYSLDYNEKYEVPNWVAYRLTEESLKAKNVPRAKRFKSDQEVDRHSAKHSDYTHSGYTRGHMAPAGDMAFNQTAMQESFYMSNMTPQIRQLNNGIWRELEENVRDWAYDNDEIYVVSGPLFYNDNPKRIGKNKVAVPDAFFKAILDNEGSKKKSIGFIIPHAKSDKHIREYAISVDELEEKTGLDMFAQVIQDEALEAELESKVEVNKWQINKKRFNQRVNHWNKEK